MTTSKTTLWLETSHHAAFRVGGWAFVTKAVDGAISGQCAGRRRIDADRLVLSALVAALQDAPGPVRLITASRALSAIPARIAAAQSGESPPEENLDLWAQAMTALAARPVEIVAAASGDRTSAFSAAWAEVGRDRGKDKGDFASAIPKPNLAKSGAS